MLLEGVTVKVVAATLEAGGGAKKLPGDAAYTEGIGVLVFEGNAFPDKPMLKGDTVTVEEMAEMSEGRGGAEELPSGAEYMGGIGLPALKGGAF